MCQMCFLIRVQRKYHFNIAHLIPTPQDWGQKEMEWYAERFIVPRIQQLAQQGYTNQQIQELLDD